MSNQTLKTEIPEKAEERINFVWRLDDQIMTNLRTKRVATSENFCSGVRGDNTQWRVVIQIGNQDASLIHVPSDDVGIFIELVAIGNFKPGVTDVNVRYEIKLIQNKERVVKIQKESQPISVGQLIGCPSVCKFGSFIFLRDFANLMAIAVTLWVHTKVTGDQVLSEYVAKRQLKSLTQFMKDMLRDGKSTDMTLRTGPEVYQVHECILAGRSPVFAAMMASGMVEAQKREVEITDFDPEIVNAMLKYMYYGDLSAAKDRPIDMLKIADKYELLELKEECEKFIVPTLTVANAAEALKFAHEHSLKEAMPSIINFINRNRMEIGKTGSLAHVAKLYPDLVLQLYLS